MGKSKRTLVVEGTRFVWALTPGDEGLRLRVRAQEAGGASLATLFDHGNLVTPWLVRQAILRGLASGWDPAAPGPERRIEVRGVVPDRPAPVPLGKVEGVEKGLLEQIAAAPEEDGPRLVYADWLLEHAEEQGELIVLSCARDRRPLSEGEQARFSELLRTRDERWLGPVAAVTGYRHWSRGLLDACQLGKKAPGVVGPALGHRAWASVRTLDACGPFLAASDVEQIVGQPILRSLRSLLVHSSVATAVGSSLALERRALGRLERLVCAGHPADARRLAVALDEAVFPALRSLVLPVQDVDDLTFLLLQPVSRRLERVGLRLGFESIAGCLAALAASVTPVAEVTLWPWWSSFARTGPSMTLRREGGRWSGVELGWDGPGWPYAGERILAALGSLDAEALTSLTIRPALPGATPPWNAPEYRRLLLAEAGRQPHLGPLLFPELAR